MIVPSDKPCVSLPALSMIFVVIALLPCLLFGIYNVGLQGAGALASEKSFFELFLSLKIVVNK